MHNLVILMEPCEDGYEISSKAGNMCLNRFCIDEDAAFELSGVHYLEPLSQILNVFTKVKAICKNNPDFYLIPKNCSPIVRFEEKIDNEIKSKGKGNFTLLDTHRCV